MPNSINPSPFNETQQPQGYFYLNREHPLAAGLVANYPFSGPGAGSKFRTGQTDLHDYSGYGHHGQWLRASGASSTSGYIFTEKGWAFDFDGLNDHFSGGASTEKLKIDKEITISAWINVDQFKNQVILTKGGTQAGDPADYVNYGFRLGGALPATEGSSNFKKLNFLMKDNSIGLVEFMSSSDVITSTSTWYHVAIKFNFGNNIEEPGGGLVLDYDPSSAKLFVNGNFVPGSWSDIGFGMASLSGYSLWIGLDIRNGGAGVSGNSSFDGKMQNILIYDRYLSDAEINQLYTKPWAIYKSPIVISSFEIPTPQTYTDTPTGGIIASGDASIDLGDTVETSGGIIANGTKEFSARFNPVLVGGAKLNGEAIYQGSSSTPLISGGLLASGEATVLVAYNQSPGTPTYYYDEYPSGGLQASGEATIFGIALGDAGLKANGIAAISATYSQQDQRCKYLYEEMPLGGLIVSGSSAGVLAFWGDGSALLSGEANISKVEVIVSNCQKFSYIETPVGGIQANGSISIEDAFQIVRLFPFNGIATPLVGGGISSGKIENAEDNSATISGTNRYFEEMGGVCSGFCHWSWGDIGWPEGYWTLIANGPGFPTCNGCESCGCEGTKPTGDGPWLSPGAPGSAPTPSPANLHEPCRSTGTGVSVGADAAIVSEEIGSGGTTTSGISAHSASDCGGIILSAQTEYFESTTGGTILSGTGSELKEFNHTTIGGLTANGTASESASVDRFAYTEVPIGGSQLNGDSTVAYGTWGGGQGKIGGAAIEFVYYNNLTPETGGIQVGGQTLQFDEIATGGIKGQGATILSEVITFATEGGIQINGAAIDSCSDVGGLIILGELTLDETGSGGALAAGLGFSIDLSGSGGAVVNGQGLDSVSDIGGVIINGFAITSEVESTHEATGGVQANGAVIEFKVSEETATGGLVASGQSSQLIEFGTFGQALLNGEATITVVYLELPSGGILANSAADEDFGDIVEVAGGLTASGAANSVKIHVHYLDSQKFAYDEYFDGGLQASGEAAVSGIALGDAGVLVSGKADMEVLAIRNGIHQPYERFEENPSGGVVLSDGVYQNITGDSGVSINGSATDSASDSGGAILNSSAITMFQYSVKGGVLAEGSATINVIRLPVISGGIVGNGTIGIYEIDSSFTVTGGIVLNSSAELTAPYNIIASGGITASGIGDPDFIDIFDTAGGIVAGGEIGAGAPDGLYGITTFTPSGGGVCAARFIFTNISISQGGVEASGSADVYFVLWPEPTGGIKAGTAGLIESPVWKYTPDGKSTNSSVIDEKSSIELGTTTSSSFDQLSSLPLIAGTLNGTIYRLDQAVQTFTTNESGVFTFFDIGESVPSPKAISGTIDSITGIITINWDPSFDLVPGENYLIFSYEFEGLRLAGVQINGASNITRGFYAFESTALIIELNGSALLRIAYKDRICIPEETFPCTVSSPTQYRECIVSSYYASNPARGQRFSSRAKLPAITLCRQSFYVPTENITIPPA